MLLLFMMFLVSLFSVYNQQCKLKKGGIKMNEKRKNNKLLRCLCILFGDVAIIVVVISCFMIQSSIVLTVRLIGSVIALCLFIIRLRYEKANNENYKKSIYVIRFCIFIIVDTIILIILLFF